MKYCLRIYPICIALVFAVLSCLTGCSGTTDGFQPTDNRLEQTDSPVLIRPADTPSVPDAGFYRGFASILPPDGDFESAYSKAAAHADFVNIWVGAPEAGYRDLAEYLGGGWGDTFVEELVRGNGMFPVINLSFIGRECPRRQEAVESQRCRIQKRLQAGGCRCRKSIETVVLIAGERGQPVVRTVRRR